MAGSELSYLYLVLGGLTALQIVRRWRPFWDEDLTEDERQLAFTAAFTILVPPIVYLHELGHAWAGLNLGGRVIAIRWHVYYGSTLVTYPGGPVAHWWVALAGNAITIVASAVLLTAGLGVRRLPRALRFMLLWAAIMESLHALVGYPLLSIGGGGDWSTIYDFRATPLASGLTAVVHAMLLVGLRRSWRTSLRARIFAIAHGEEDELHALRIDVARNPRDAGSRYEFAQLFIRHRDYGLAERALEDAVRHCGEDVRLLAELGHVQVMRDRPEDAVRTLQRALEVAASDDPYRDALNEELAIALVDLERYGEALDALAAVGEQGRKRRRFSYWRGIASLRSGDLAGARRDFEAVLSDPARADDPIADGARRLLDEVRPASS